MILICIQKNGVVAEIKLIQIPSIIHLKYDHFKQNIKSDNFIEHNLEALYSDSDDSHYSSNIINRCRYLVETSEDKFISATGDSSLIIYG